jgi:Predicted carbamoyl transferase, NodU family
MDGVGEWTTTSAAHGQGKDLKIMREIHFPHSVGLLYSAFTYYTGFKVNSGEYKLMGLAPYGEPKYAQLILDKIMDLKPDGSFRLDQSYFDYCTGLTMTNSRFNELFGGPPRRPEQKVTQREMDLAASIQAVTEEVMLRLTRSLAKETGARNLCLAGGVALNCVANGKILRDPASSGSGSSPPRAMPAARWARPLPPIICCWASRASCPATISMPCRAPTSARPMSKSIEKRLEAAGAKFTVLDEASLIRDTAQALADEKAVGWHQGAWSSGRARWRPLDPGRPALPQHAEDPQSEGQIPRILPALRALRPARGCGGVVRARG